MHEIETTRLLLRLFTPDDLIDLYRIYRDRQVMKYVGIGARTLAETEAALCSTIDHWQQHGFGMWAVVEKKDDRTIGRCGLCFLDNTPEVELGYVLDKAYWGRGLATEAARASLKYGFAQLKLQRIVAIAHPENLASQRVMQKLGMKFASYAHYYHTDVALYALESDRY